MIQVQTACETATARSLAPRHVTQGRPTSLSGSPAGPGAGAGPRASGRVPHATRMRSGWGNGSRGPTCPRFHHAARGEWCLYRHRYSDATPYRRPSTRPRGPHHASLASEGIESNRGPGSCRHASSQQTFVARAGADRIAPQAEREGEGRASGMGSEGRSLNGGAVPAAAGCGAEEKLTTAALVAAGAPAEVPTSAASLDISLPLPEMTPHVMQVPSALSSLLWFHSACARVWGRGWFRRA